LAGSSSTYDHSWNRQGLVLSPVTSIAVENTAQNLSGVSSSMINVMLQIGGAFGLAILSIISKAMNSQSISFHYQVIGITIFSLTALCLSLILVSKSRIISVVRR